VPLKNGAYTPPAVTLMPDDVATLNWLLPVARNVPLDAVTPFVNVPLAAVIPVVAVIVPAVRPYVIVSPLVPVIDAELAVIPALNVPDAATTP
jgi:hypothetical protein